jgi:type I restriction enzyme M protein
MKNFQEKVGFIWSIAEILRGDFKQSEYGKVVLPLTVLRRLDCVLEKTKDKVLIKSKALPKNADEAMKDLMLAQAAGQSFYNLSRFTFKTLLNDQDHLAANLDNYITNFSANAREIFLDKFKFGEQVRRLDEANLLYLVLKRFDEIDLHPEAVDNHEMGSIFEELIRRFSEQSNETAGEHFTPREVIRLKVNILFNEDGDVLTKKGIIRTFYDPAAGTGGILSVAENYLRDLNPSATLKTFGQELNPESYAICKSDMLIKGEDASNIKFGNSFTQDGFPGQTFDYLASNPPFGVDWKKYQKAIEDERNDLGMGGRFGAGLPRVSDGSLLFLQHMISKFKKGGAGSRLSIVFNGSPLFTGGAGSGESEIRRWIIENDWLEAIVALPDQLFYNTGINTYLWIVTNRKSSRRRGKVQLVNAVGFFQKMRRSLGNKRNEITEEQTKQITRLYGDFRANEFSKILDNEDFGYWRITVERPLRLNFAVTPERLERLRAASAFVALADGGKKGRASRNGEADAQAVQRSFLDADGDDCGSPGQVLQRAILEALDGLSAHDVCKNRDEFTGRLKGRFKAQGVTVPTPLFKAVLTALSERDETADICTDAKGNPDPDPELRDYENVPLKYDIHDYFRREVLPHVPDAWIDETKTKKGYEIPFTRYFYQFTPLRPLAEIEAEITALEAEIQDMLKGVLA